ncbi:hypothetical protein [Anaerocolumna chitinilytica]|uniref:Chagasin family peptidase inhibitor I42 n=1 Tax=Anaerocolumna chitinilytica TaxID=1727145 RepID=A0A7I8DIG4_9FIRM|nr:hypothetical protein [Anaerocolumna chitinilytica]BCJ98130.1 hypothetical protein bsdcttw_11710 [Anaerocolumna chitinilytica]
MKKVLSRILAVAIAIVLFSSPSIVQAASNPVLIYDEYDLKVFELQPDPYKLIAGQSVTLENTTSGNGWWYVPAGYTVKLGYFLDNPGYHQMKVFRSGVNGENTMVYYDSQMTNDGYPSVLIPPQSEGYRYLVTATAYSNITISQYWGYVKVE